MCWTKPEMLKVRRIIGQRAYDTTTASVIAHWHGADNPDNYPGDFGEVLFKNLYGIYFLAFFNYEIDPWDGCYEGIRPLTRDAAIAWMEKHSYTSLIEDEFGVMPEAGAPDNPLAPVLLLPAA